MRMEAVQTTLIIVALIVGVIILMAGGRVVETVISLLKDVTGRWLGA